jgi:hypothetical protein
MNALIRSAIAGQFGAAVKMFRDCLERGEGGTWLAAVGKFPFWQVAYHTLFTTDLYLAASETEFQPQAFHHEGYDELGPQPWAPRKTVVIDRPYDQATLIGYADLCRTRARRALDLEGDDVLAGPSGLDWLKFTRLELHLYNIRHLQHHTGQLTAALRRERGEGIKWALRVPLQGASA